MTFPLSSTPRKSAGGEHGVNFHPYRFGACWKIAFFMEYMESAQPIVNFWRKNRTIHFVIFSNFAIRMYGLHLFHVFRIFCGEQWRKLSKSYSMFDIGKPHALTGDDVILPFSCPGSGESLYCSPLVTFTSFHLLYMTFCLVVDPLTMQIM